MAHGDADSAFRFHGTWREFAPIALTNLLLIIVTLGIYRFWAKAHEIGHVERRHVLVALARRFGLGLLIGSGGDTAQYGQALIEARYGRAAEAEADEASIEHLVAARISPAPTAALFDRLGRAEARMPRLLTYMASHPPSAERKRRFEAAAKRVPHPRPALGPQAWASVRSICGDRP